MEPSTVPMRTIRLRPGATSKQPASAGPAWRKAFPNLPAGSDSLPPGEGFPLKKIVALNVHKWKDQTGLGIAQTLHTITYALQQWRDGKFVLKANSDLGLADVFANLDAWGSFERFDDFFRPWTFIRRPAVAARWMEDAEFGRQRLTGINPAHIRRATAKDLSDFLEGAEPGPFMAAPGLSLEAARERGQLYFLEYRIFRDIVGDEVQAELGRYALAPECMLYQPAGGELVPVAIRLRSWTDEKDVPERIFTPTDPPDQWLSAKIAVSSADAIFQGEVTHLLYAHLIMEPFAVSTLRNLPASHPLYQLLKPHFYNTIAINELARQRFLPRGGFFDITSSIAAIGSLELLARAYMGEGRHGYRGSSWEFYKRALPHDLSTRDVGDLNNYHYRDDALLHWAAIETYVTEVLRYVYPTSQRLSADVELQTWIEELVSPDFGGMRGLLPPKRAQQLEHMDSADDLASILTNLIFTATAYHAAVNFGQTDYYTWIPNAQFATYQPFDDLLSDSKQPAGPLERLPGRSQSIKQMILSRSLSMGPPLTSDSLMTMKPLFQDQALKDAFTRYRHRLGAVEREIRERNAKRQYPYHYLLPSQVPQSIAI